MMGPVCFQAPLLSRERTALMPLFSSAIVLWCQVNTEAFGKPLKHLALIIHPGSADL
jgi:hypothetical protein